MNGIYKKTLQTLELNRVLDMLAKNAVSEEAKEKCRELLPSADFNDIKRMQDETEAARRLMTLRGGPSFSGVKRVGDSLKRADMGGSLNTRELINVAGLLRAARTVRAYLDADAKEKTCIDFLFFDLRANKYLEEKITNTVIGEDEIADTASSELSAVRRLMRATNGRIRETLQKIITSPAYSKCLQEAIITIRSDRYVVPVKSEHKNDISGLIHDVSASGATVFIEPMQVVQANNELRELAAREEKEIERILAELSAEVSEYSEDISRNYDILVCLDCIFARAKLAYELKCSPPAIAAEGETVLKRARHPLLDPKTAVPIDLRLGGDFDTLVITGPNTGGKTVTLKTVGLLTLMAECGLQIPADDGSRIRVYARMFADIGDEQSIEQSLSTFSSHMTNIVTILKETDDKTLALFDELGAGTDPVEGAALAISIIEHARGRGATIAATTHYSELKTFALTTKGVENASCEFDVETLRPTYRLLIGVPGKSNAFAISKRLGLPDEIIEHAREQIGSENTSFEDVLSELEHKRRTMEAEKVKAEALRREIEENTEKIRQSRDYVEREREKVREKARAEAEGIIEDAKRTVDEVLRELDELRKKEHDSEHWQEINKARSEMRRKLNAASKADMKTSAEPPPPSRPAEAGDTVEILSVGTKAEVISVGKDGVLALQAGILKISAKQEEVRALENSAAKTNKGVVRNAGVQPGTRSASVELDLRGMMKDEAEGVLDMFLDNALMSNLNVVTIIHGKGTGALRAMVQTRLRGNKRIKSFRLGRFGEGEAGVTIVELK